MGNEYKRYKYLAYCVVRDALGFYIGIPLFLNTASETREAAFKNLTDRRVRRHYKKFGELPTDPVLLKYKTAVARTMERREAQLLDDLENAKAVLFTDNLWLQWLGLSPEWMSRFVQTLSAQERELFALVPTWYTSDESLGRAHITDVALYNKLNV